MIRKIKCINSYAGVRLEHPKHKGLVSVIWGSQFHPNKKNLFEVGCCYMRFDTWEEVIAHLDEGCEE